MINRITVLFERGQREQSAPSHEQKHLAAAVLLVEAACMDGHFDKR